VTEILIYVITVSEVSSSAMGSLSSILYSWFSLDNINLGYTKHFFARKILLVIVKYTLRVTICMFRVKFSLEKTFWNQNDRATFLAFQDRVEVSTCLNTSELIIITFTRINKFSNDS